MAIVEVTKQIESEIQYNLKGFAFFFSGQLFSILGSSVVQFVLIWWVTIETESALLLSLAALVGFFPRIILTPIAGVFVDRWNRKALIATVDIIQAISTVALVFLFKFEMVTIWILFLFLTVRGAADAFQSPAVASLVPIMVPKKHLSRANSVQYLLTNVITLLGPMLAALLMSFIPISNVLWIDPITFGIAIIPLLLIKIPKITKKEKAEKKNSFGTEFKEGIRFMKEKKGLFSLMFSFATTNFFIMPLFILINLYLYVNHGGTETNLAFVLAFSQAGSIVGTLVFILWKGFKKRVYGVSIGIIGGFVGGLIVAFAPKGMFWLMGVGFLILGFFISMANISSQTIWQNVVPREMLGRVFSVRFTIAQIISPLAMVISGLIAAKINIQYVMIASLILGLISFSSFFIFSSMRKVEEKEVEEVEIIKIPGEKIDSTSTKVEALSPP
ncbi:MAG: MFS transporter [Asgard group archaeon]|nr:MFS transporter [Asgard group archaeon]